MTYSSFSFRKTPQNQPIPGKGMVKNNGGGYGFQIDKWQQLHRFLVIGSDTGTYYVNSVELTKNNGLCVMACLDENYKRTIDLIVEISQSGRAPKNDPALFALAIAAGDKREEVRKYALNNLYQVARTGTHLFQFLSFVKQFRGWGRALKRAVNNWYFDKDFESLGYQIVKYRQRNGWTHRDVFRLTHPIPPEELGGIFQWVVRNEVHGQLPLAIEGYLMAKESSPNPRLIEKYGLTWEMLPTEWLNDKEVWAALLPHMPITALIRNLAKMTDIGLLQPFSSAVNTVIDKLNINAIKRGRVHPIAILNAVTIYSRGYGEKGNLVWNPVPQITDRLNQLFYQSFETVEPNYKRHLLAIDVSGSMEYEAISGMSLSAAQAATAMAMITAKVEPNYYAMGFSNVFKPLDISPSRRLPDVMEDIYANTFGSTNCALPMIWALENKVPVDVFIIYTDNETNYGDIHPCQAIREYREKMGINAKLFVVGMTATDISIADPEDPGMLDVVGFDSNTPSVISQFV
jgi:60 kDa SS-A/Ro ribonucleoprotein